MSLRNKIQQDIKQALKGGEKDKLQVLRFLNAQIQDQEIEQQRKKLTDDDIAKIIGKQIKKLEESIELFKKGQREDLVDKAKKEIQILKAYLPEQVSGEELAKVVEDVIKENPGIDQPGPLIGKAVAKLAGKADNKEIAQLVIQKLKESKES